MKRLTLLIIFISLFLSCQAQRKSNFEWKNFVFEDAGVKADFPCEPTKKVKVWQEKPIMVRDFDFICESNDINFGISVHEDTDEITGNRIQSILEASEGYLQETAGKNVKFLKRENLTRDNLPSRYYEAELFGNGKWTEIRFVKGRTTYKAYAVAKLKPGQQIEDLGRETAEITQKFIDSFHVITK